MGFLSMIIAISVESIFTFVPEYIFGKVNFEMWLK